MIITPGEARAGDEYMRRIIDIWEADGISPARIETIAYSED